MSSSTGEDAGEENVLTEVIEFAKKMHDDLRYLPYFLPNQQENFNTLKQQAQLIFEYLDAIPIEQRQSDEDKAMYLYLRGKFLDVISPGYNQEEVNHLSKSLKLNQNNVDAWICLGTCIMKGGDLNNAKQGFTFGLEKFPENKELLCHLSVVERRLCRDTEDEKAEEIIGESIKHARKAISMDVNDGISWYALGNAYLTAYFVTGCWDVTMLRESLKAYKNAAKDERIKLSPYMFYNCAMAYKFLENYKKALAGFKGAGLRDPGQRAQDKLNLYEILDEIKSLLQNLNDANWLPSPTSSLPTVDFLSSSLASVDLDSSYEKATVNHLTEGYNPGKAVTGKVLFSVKNPSKIPSYYVVCDSDLKCFVVTVYSVCSTAIKEDDMVTLLDPFYHFFDFESEGKSYQFKSVRVDLLPQLLVNGAIVSPEHLIHSSMCPQLKEA